MKVGYKMCTIIVAMISMKREKEAKRHGEEEEESAALLELPHSIAPFCASSTANRSRISLSGSISTLL